MNKKVEEICNRQIQREVYSSHLYLAMASWAETNGLKGVADWFYVQSDEERIHALKFVKYINERGGKAKIGEIEEPPSKFENVKKAFEAVMKHEEFISNSINEIVSVCIQEKDFTTHNWVQWFVNEQIEEEASVHEILDKLKLIGDGSLYLFDRDILGMRTTAKGTE